MNYTIDSQIYVNGHGCWYRVLQLTDTRVLLNNEQNQQAWFSRKEIDFQMNQPEPSQDSDD